MSDSQKFGGPAGIDVVDSAPIPAEVETSAPRFTPKMLAVAGGVIVVLGLAAYFLLFSGGGSDDSASTGLVPAAPHTSTAPSKAVASAAPSVVPGVAGTGLSSGGRDPFAPLVTAATATTAASASSSATTPAGTGTTTAGVTSTLAVVSVDFTGNTANVLVNGKAYVAHAGELFAKYYVMYGVTNAQCAGFQFGDLPAQVCKGQMVKFTG